MQEKSIINVLCHLRLEALRSDRSGLAEIETLMRQRGFDPDSQLVRDHRPRRFKRGQLARAITAALRDGPKTGPEVVKYVADAHDMNVAGVRNSVHVALSGGAKRGAWLNDDGLWKLNRSC